MEDDTKITPPSDSTETEALVAAAQSESSGAEAEKAQAEAAKANAEASKAQAETAKAEAEKAKAEAAKASAEAAKAEAEAQKAQAESARAKNERKTKSAEGRRRAGRLIFSAFSALSTTGKIAVFAVPAILIIVAVLVIPSLGHHSETKYFSANSLKTAVNIESLSTVEHNYTGIAEQPGKWLWMDNIAYRVKYTATVSAKCNMSEIEFVVDEGSKTVTAYLPEAELEDPVVDSNTLDFLPSDPGANISDIIKLCKEDAINDIDKNQIQQEAYESLQSTVDALTLPILGDGGWKLKYDKLENYKPESEEAATDEASTEAAGTATESAETEANNEAK